MKSGSISGVCLKRIVYKTVDVVLAERCPVYTVDLRAGGEVETTLMLLLNETEGPKYKTKTASGHFDPSLSGMSTQLSAPVLTRPGEARLLVCCCDQGWAGMSV